MIRYFRATDAVVEAVRATLDAAWGYPSPETLTETSFDPAHMLPHDGQGLAYLIVSAEFCGYEPAANMLVDLLASGAVEEMTEADYLALSNV